MKTDMEILGLLIDYKNKEYLSGEKLASMLNISRNSIWKAIEKLKKSGYEIDSVHGKGYRLISNSDILSEVIISKNTDTTVMVFDELSSTNEHIKKIPASDLPFVVLADGQTQGKGRLGREFVSAKGKGLYMSYSFKPKLAQGDTMLITCGVANLVREAILETCHLDTKLKWVNDIYMDGKKLCGILTEGEFNLETHLFDRIIIGIGLNCYHYDVPSDLREKVGFINDFTGAYVSRNDLSISIINRLNNLFYNKESLDNKSIIEKYKENCFMINKVIKLSTFSGEPISVLVLDIGEKGELVVEYLEGPKKGKKESIISGEILL